MNLFRYMLLYIYLGSSLVSRSLRVRHSLFHHSLRPLIGLVFCGFILPSTVFASKESASLLANQLDLRIVIDVSGSMQDTDPKNLRIPALQVLTQLLPEDAQVGVWEFAEDIKVLVPYGAVDSQWRQRALSTAENIRSDGRFTDIGSALKAVAFDQKITADNPNLHVILLTDGMVDIADDAVANIRARNQLIRHITKSFVTNGALVHTVGLSRAVDAQTLRELSRKTNGLFAIAETPAELLKIFLHVLDNSLVTQQLSVAAGDQLVNVSENTQSITMVVERNKQQTVLISPSGKAVNKLDDNVEWKQFTTHDIVTIQEPEQGTWMVGTEGAKIIRVNVESDVQLDLSLADNHIFVGQTIDLQMQVKDNQGLLVDPKTLANAHLTFTLDDAQGQRQWQHKQELINGNIILQSPAIEDAGLYRLRVELTVQGQGQVQKVERSIRINPPIAYVITQQKTDLGVKYAAEVIPLNKQLDLDSIQVLIIGKHQDGSNIEQPLSLVVDKWQGSWVSEEPARTLGLRLEGKTYDGNEISFLVADAELRQLSAAQVKQLQQADSVAVEYLPVAEVIEVNEDDINTESPDQAQVSSKEVPADVQTLMKKDEEENIQQGNTIGGGASDSQVTVDLEPAEQSTDMRLAMLVTLLLIFIGAVLWYRRRPKVKQTGASQDSNMV